MLLVSGVNHTWNSIQTLYGMIQASIALFPQSSGGAIKDDLRIAISDYIKVFAKELYYAGNETVGISVVNGELTVIDKRLIPGGKYLGWKW